VSLAFGFFGLIVFWGNRSAIRVLEGCSQLSSQAVDVALEFARAEPASRDAKVTIEKGRPAPAEIAAYTRDLLATGQVSRGVALSGLMESLDALRRDFRYSDHELRPITDLIDDLSDDGRTEFPPTSK
jgi:hypothetical protein